jgi:ATP-binding cassette, subfamily B, bacterial
MKGIKKFPLYRQLDTMDCGPTCLRMIAKYYGKHYSLQSLRNQSYITREGVSLKGISEAAESIGFRTIGAKLSFEQLDDEAVLPCILHWNQNHFVVLPPQNYNRKNRKNKISIIDPDSGFIRVDKETFLNSWVSTEDGRGIALLLEPSPFFYKAEDENAETIGRAFLFRYLKHHFK